MGAKQQFHFSTALGQANPVRDKASSSDIWAKMRRPLEEAMMPLEPLVLRSPRGPRKRWLQRSHKEAECGW